jgi:hypothetical protein
VGEDADVPDAVGRLLQRHQLVARNDGHAGRVWSRLGAKTAEAVVVFRVVEVSQSSAGRAVSLQMAGVQAEKGQIGGVDGMQQVLRLAICYVVLDGRERFG